MNKLPETLEQEYTKVWNETLIECGYAPLGHRFLYIDGDIILEGLADCPCGLGISTFSFLVGYGATLREPPVIKDELQKEAMLHIEKDKKAGRWV